LGHADGLRQPVLNLVSYLFYAFPHPLGSPATLDGWKLLRSELFNVAYFGALPFLAGIAAVQGQRGPHAARWLFAAGLLLPLTTLVGPLYHRVVLVAILGGCWLFAYLLQHEAGCLRTVLRRLAMIGLGLVVLWAFASVALWLIEPRLQHWLAPRLLGRGA
jgi:hypothetical protein